jgi:basic membrane protein A and related proteins
MRRLTITAGALLAATLVVATGQAREGASGPRVGFVAYSGNTPNPRTLEGSALAGFLRAEQRLPIRGRVQYISPTQGPGTVLRSFSRQGYKLVVAPIFDSSSVDQISKAYPRVHFIVIDAQPAFGPKRRARNIHRVVFRAEEAGYLAGYLSALMADRRGGTPTISAVGGFRFYGVTRWIVGFRAGARHADAHVRVRVDYSNDFANPSKCRRLALAQIAAGSRVVFDVAGACGLGALAAARQKHVWGVGVDVDQAFLGPHILTSAVSRFDRGVYDAIRLFTRGKLGRSAVYSVRSGGVELGKISERVPPDFVRRVAEVRRRIANGTIVVPRPPG